ncbi:hypothetical protein BDB00DRAFT_830687 [Zychaea mexicana]|uniref:uncharacterized protein n=1 Tax=Zychaea mexicana TaxID=64656 RepID=UPI0022FEE9B2|nr:uncharacterized protein BDB00DRAFT_830687 [Zychaea mexicana]KAI9491995.1 hypothetical protein BDB00DRAFT_830687 [Zychaea mexicana]
MAEDDMKPERSTSSSRTTGSDIGELQQKISKAERELTQLRVELQQTQQQAKAAELHAQESGRTNRKLKTEIQTLTDMSNRKDRQAENAKATAFFFEGQVKKYTDEIETAQRGMGHLKELDDQLREAKEQQQKLETNAQEEHGEVRGEIRRIQEKYRAEKSELQDVISKAYEELAATSSRALQIQKEAEERIKDAIGPMDVQIKELEQEHLEMEQRQADTIREVQQEVEQLRQKLDNSEASTRSHEEIMTIVRNEMDRIMRRLRAIDQAEL